MQTRSSASAEHRQLQIMDPTSFPGNISPGKTVVNQPRSLGSRSKGNLDKYFIDPMTGRQFPSLESARRYLNRERTIVENKTRVYEGSRTKQDNRSNEYASKDFRLPQGWTVYEIQRKNSNHVDKYYVEPITGRRFRSLVSVERYLEESRKRSDEQLMLLEYHRGHSKDFTLPVGWIIEEKPRKESSHIDRSYIELETGKKFGSLASVERYLQEVGNSTLNSDPMVHPEPLLLTINGNDDTRFRDEVIDSNPPKKVKWVLTGPGGNMFNAKVSGSDISSSVIQKWSEAFVTLIQDQDRF